MKRKQIMAAFLTAAMALTMAACGGDSSTGSSGAASGAATAEGGEYKDTLVVGTYGDQDTLDPQVNVTNDKVLRLLYDGLLTHGEDGTIEAALAESWEHSEDYLTWTFKLKEGIKFANGKELTSADVVATFERLINKDHPLRYSEKVEFLDSVTAIDDYTVEFTCNTATPIFEETFASQCCFIMDADYIAEYGYDIGIDPATINGTGPYTVTTWNADEVMIFEANPNWWGGTPGCQTIEYRVIPEASSRAMALETGEIDVLDRPSVEDYERLSQTEGLVGVSELGYGMHGFQFNCSEYSPCQDVNVRKAISYAIDRETMVEALYGPIGEVPTHSPLTPNVLYYEDLGVAPYDPEKAKELLAEAGYADGLEISIMTTGSYNKAVESAEVIKQQLEAVGITATIETVDSATFQASLNGITPEELPWDMFIMGFGGSGLDPDAALRRVFETSADGLNTNNYGWYSNARVDELLEAGRVEMDPEKRAEMYKEVQQIVYLDDPVAVYTNLRSSLYVISDKVENFGVNVLQVVEYENVKVKA